MMISVIIPVYNVEQYLTDCLESVVNQKCDDYEVICINDGSTDNSLPILEEYAQKYSFINIYSKENGGLSSARNYGLSKANGKYVYFLDSDDMLADTECLSFMVENMENEKLEVLYFDGTLFWEANVKENRNVLGMYQRKNSYGIYEKGQELFADMVTRGEYCASVCLKCYKMEYLSLHNMSFINKLLHEDEIFTFIEMLTAQKVMHVKRDILARRMRQGSIMQQRPKFQNFYSLFIIYREMYEFCRNEDYPVHVENAISQVIEGICKSAQNKFYRMDKGEREKINELPLYEQKLIKSVFLNKENESTNEYRFPYHLFREKDKVAIYGAGNVGRNVYYQAVWDNLIEVVGIVDQRVQEIDDGDIPVMPVNALKEWEYDYVLIAIKNRNIAMEIRNTLLKLDIPNEKIKWGEDIFDNLNCIGQVRQYDKFIRRQIEGKTQLFYLFMLPEHGNMGDYAIGYAEKKFFSDYFPEHELICVTTHEWLNLKETFKKMIRKEDVIFISGGGYFGDLWTSGSISKEIVETFPNNKRVYMPNNLTYKNGNWMENENVERDMQWLAEQENVSIFFREKKSYDYARRYVNNCFYVPDMALYLHFPQNAREKKNNILLCMRNDCEKAFADKQELYDAINRKGYYLEEFDINLKKYLSQEDGMICLQEIIEKLQTYDLVITDRLHGMILSVVSEVPCIAFDNLTRKVSGVYEWIKNRKTVVMINDSNRGKLSTCIDSMLGNEIEPYQIDLECFGELAEHIKNIVV